MSDAQIWVGRILGVAVLAAMPFLLDGFWLNVLALALIYSFSVFSLTLLTGFTGLLSFGQAGFIGLGAYCYGVMTVAHYPPALAAVAGVALAAAAGLLLGLPAARLRGHYLAICTLAFGILVGQVLNNAVDVTRGPMGLLGIRSIGLDRTQWYYLLLALVVATISLINVIDRHLYLGVVLKSVKYDEISASASGVGAFGIKLAMFCLSAAMAGFSGVLLAAYVRFLTPDLFLPAESFRVLMMAVVGGVGSATGGLIAAILLTAIPEGLRRLGESSLRLLVYGVMVLFVLWFLPGGIGGLIGRFAHRVRRLRPAVLTGAPAHDTASEPVLR
jgi:branched-chain amino acid transport system permease protein